ncbi:hypothetical protein RhiirC2_854461 [Rhizophagus irregularis]|uniref:Uncharacterized protein n=1 Tax=Rhizophagus irregularis TaxID=588596 RepID=A0A2N1MRJ2_9GLOM|nr:hypothetical protein RhiirC2_854461 [Rhizophagus irregularis]
MKNDKVLKQSLGNDLRTVLKDLGIHQENLRNTWERSQKRLENGLGGPRTLGNDLGMVLENSGNSLGKAIVDAVL